MNEGHPYRTAGSPSDAPTTCLPEDDRSRHLEDRITARLKRAFLSREPIPCDIDVSPSDFWDLVVRLGAKVFVGDTFEVRDGKCVPMSKRSELHVTMHTPCGPAYVSPCHEVADGCIVYHMPK